MSTRARYRLAALAVALLVTLILITMHSRPELAARAAGTSPPAPVDPPAGADPDWVRTVSADLAGREYQASVTEGGLQAPNRAHNLRTHFAPNGIAIEPRLSATASGWRFAWETQALGRPGRMVDAEPVSPAGHGARVTYERSGWSEWYENTPEGLEQGFTLERRPPGDGPLRITGALAPGLTSELVAGEVEFRDPQGAHVLHYGKLVTRDAQGGEVPSEILLAGSQLILEVDDRCATYPLLVDPLMTSPAWTAEANQAEAGFGASLVTAGDVNGDGFSDVIVGAPRYDNGQAEEGRAYVFRGSAAGLATTPAWTAESNQADARFAISVAAAGDVNGDGYADVIVGAHFYGNGQTREGRAFVYHGSAAGLASAPAWTAESNQIDAEFGQAVASAGDVNGDGYSDVIVGAPSYSNGQVAEGRVFAYHGSSTGLATSPAWFVESNMASCAFGSTVASAGDYNGDGYADVLVGASSVTNGQISEGRAYAYPGSVSGLSLDASWIIESNQEFASFGAAIATAGDVNGDGFSDILVGAYRFDNGEDAEGKVFAYYGSAAGPSAVASWTGESNQAGTLFGAAVGTAGDVNGDGYADVVIGATGWDNGETDEGRAYVYLGSKLGLIAAAWTVESDQSNAVLGSAVSTAGDVNGDGFSDVLVAAVAFDNQQANEGRAFVYHGGPSGLSSVPMFWTTGGQNTGFWGWEVGSAGDVNGDGYSDLFAVASNFDNGQFDEGKVWVYYGSFDGVPSSPSWSAETNQASAEIGSAACAGDFNGDGYSDFIYGSYYLDAGESNEGAAFLHLGSANGLSAVPLTIYEGGQASAWLGTVAGAGDVNGDGYGDILIGAEGLDNDQVNEGRALLISGSASGLGLIGWMVEGNEDGAFLGSALGPAGDVNRDGFADILIGAPLLDHGESDEGVVWVFHGTTAGFGTTPARILEADQAGASFGSEVATAGDVNGDGYSDVIIGADHFDCGQVDEGKAFLYYGGAQGLPAAPAWTTESDQTSAWLGKGVGTAGDVNGDGYSDLIVGAPRYDDGEIDEGRVWIYHGSPTTPGPPVLLTQGDQPGALFGYSVGTAGDVNGDGFSEVVVGSPGYDFGPVDAGLVLVLPGNQGDGLHRPRVQMRDNELVPIAIGGRSDSPSAFEVMTLARTPAGRGQVRTEIEVKPLGTPFNGLGLVRFPWVRTGSPSVPHGSAVNIIESLIGLQAGRVYHWRLRIATDSPFFPHSPWLWHPGNSATEGDLRIGGPPVGIAESEAPPAGGVTLSPAAPNPFAGSTALTFTLPARAAARVLVYDVQGRVVRSLAEDMQAAGRHEVRWDGRDTGGRRLPAGVYFVHLEQSGRVAAQKVVLKP